MSELRKIPSDFYRKRRLVSDQLAACVLIDPRRNTPSRFDLPRDLVSDPNLREILRLAIMRRTPESLCLSAFESLGRYYVCDLLKMLTVDSYPKQAFVWYQPLYVFKLRQFEESLKAYYLQFQELEKTIDAAANLCID